MNKKLLFLLATVCLFIGIALGATIRDLPVPATWASSVGNYFRIKSDANIEVRKAGTGLVGIATNVFSGATQRVPLTNGSIALNFVNGVYMGTNSAP